MHGAIDRSPVLERVSSHIVVRILIYVQTALYLFVFVSTLISPTGATTDYWRKVILDTLRNATVITFLFYARHYFANFTVRRASLALRRRDAAIMCSLFLAFILFDRWPWGVLYAIPVAALIYLWERWEIEKIERSAPIQK